MARPAGHGGPGGPPIRRVARREDPLARLRAICLALPEANEKTSHGEPTWFAGKGKVFAMLDDHHHGGNRHQRRFGSSHCPR